MKFYLRFYRILLHQSLAAIIEYFTLFEYFDPVVCSLNVAFES